MLINLWILLKGSFGKGTSCLHKLILPPRHLFHANIIQSICSLEWFNDSLLCLAILSLNHLINLLELLINLLHNHPIFIIQHFFILSYLDINMFYFIQLLFKSFEILLVISCNILSWIFTWKDSMIFVDCTTIDTVDT